MSMHPLLTGVALAGAPHSHIKHACAALFAVLLAAAPLAQAAPTIVVNPTPGTGFQTLLNNGGFEQPFSSGTPAWNLIGAVGAGMDLQISNLQAFSGSNSLQASVSQTRARTCTFCVALEQKVPLDLSVVGGPIATYVIGAYFYNDSITDALLVIDVLTTNDAVLYSALTPQFIPADTWAFVYDTFDMTTSSIGQRLRIVWGFGTVGEVGYIDDVSLTRTSEFRAPTSANSPPPTNGVPEPASLALLGFGLAGLVVTRRKAA